MFTSIPMTLLRSVISTFTWRLIMLKSPAEEYDTRVIALPLAPALAVRPILWKYTISWLGTS